VNPEILGNAAIYPPEEVKTRLQVDLAESDAFTQLLTATWTRFKAAQ
jgi:hypothetical protein